MPLPSFAKQEEVPEAFRESYVEREGKWVPDDSDVAGLKSSQKRLLDEKKKADAEVERFRTTLGDHKLEDVAELLKTHAATEEERQKKAGEFDKLLEKRVNETKAEYEKRLAEVLPYKAKYEDRELDIAIRNAAAGKIIPELTEDVVELVKGKRIKLDEKTGKPIVYDRDGDPTGMTLDKYFAETFKAERPHYYPGALGGGGGANGGGGRKGANGDIVLTADDAKDVQKYRAAKAKAEKDGVSVVIEG